MVVLVTCKNEEDPIKMKELEWSQHYSLIFKMLKGSLLQNKNLKWDLDEIQTHPSFNSCPYCMQE